MRHYKGEVMKKETFISYVDHTLLKPDASWADHEKVINEAHDYGFKAVCLATHALKRTKSLLEDLKSQTLLCTVVGFPHGNSTSSIKIFETEEAIRLGADEVDMVINLMDLKDQKYDLLLGEIEQLSKICHSADAILKVIVETAYLNREQIIKLTQVCEDAGADFIKTSTGFASRGASLEDIKIMKSSIKKGLRIKASGGIANLEDAKLMIEAGASRLGLSRSIQILNECEE